MSGKNKKKGVILFGAKYPKDVEELIKYGRDCPGLPGICKSIAPVAPDCMRVCLSYGFNVAVTGSAGEVETYTFTGNGLFDPDVTGAGAQPIGFDQWHAFYGKHRGIASSIEFSITTPEAASNDAQILDAVVYPLAVNVPATTVVAGKSMPYAKSKAIIGTFMYGRNQFTSSMSTSEIMGISPQALVIEDSLSGTNSANASDLWYWVTQFQPTDQSAATTYRLVGVVHYLVDFYDRNLAALSAGSSDAFRAAQKGKKRKSLK